MKILNAVLDYLRSSKAELEKVAWPSRRDTLRYSALVLGASVMIAAFFAALDIGLNRVVEVALEKRTANSVPAETPTTESRPAAPTETPKFEIQDLETSSDGVKVLPLEEKK